MLRPKPAVRSGSGLRLLATLLMAEHYQTWLLAAVASLGNILGSCVNWFLGRFIAHYEDGSWVPMKRETVARAEAWYHRYSRWSLLMSWSPIVGDPLIIVPGVLREPLPVFLALVTVAKTLRYVAVAAVQHGWF